MRSNITRGTGMTTDAGTALVFTDAEGHYYVIWPDLIKQARLPEELAGELRDALSDNDTAGFFTPVPIPDASVASTNLKLLGAVQLSELPNLRGRLEKVGFTPITIP
jgi:hypothetical protein